jgi:hypothetical protein
MDATWRDNIFTRKFLLTQELLIVATCALFANIGGCTFDAFALFGLALLGGYSYANYQEKKAANKNGGVDPAGK